MDIQAYIDSGILELYALGQVSHAERDEVERLLIIYPEIKSELTRIELDLENLAMSCAVETDPALIYTILDRISSIENDEEIMQPLPLIEQGCDYRRWKRYVEKEIPADFSDGRFTKVLRHSDGVMQVLLVSSTDFEDEVHDDLHESFLILEGACKCTVGESQFFMEAGDFMEIPLYEVHRVDLLTQPVIAILQRIAI